MKTCLTIVLAIVVAACGVAGAQAPPAAPSATQPPAGATVSLDGVIRDVEASYTKLNDLRAEFSQEAFNKSLNQTIPAKGVVYVKKGGKLRWEYSEPTAQEIVSDGKTLWVYTPALQQVNTGPAPEALAGPAGSFLAGLGKLREHFDVRFLNPAQPRDTDGNWALDLKPKQNLPTLSRLVLAIDPKEFIVRKAVVYDQFENTVSMKFTKLSINTGLADKLFTFVPPKGVATVPMR